MTVSKSTTTKTWKTPIVYGMYETAFTPMYDFDYAAAQGSVLLVALGTIAILQFRLLGRKTRLD